MYGGAAPSEGAALERAALLGGTTDELWAVAVFKRLPLQDDDGNDGGLGGEYTLRLNYTVVPTTWRRVDARSHHLRNEYKQWTTSGFLSLQSAIDGALAGGESEGEGEGESGGEAAGASPSSPSSPSPSPAAAAASSPEIWASAPFPTPGYFSNRFYETVGPLLSLVMVFCLLYPGAMLAAGLVEEKETRARETMAIMGLKPWCLCFAWAATYAVVLLLGCTLATLLMVTTFLSRADPTLLLAFLYMFALSQVAMAFLLSACFSSARWECECVGHAWHACGREPSREPGRAEHLWGRQRSAFVLSLSAKGHRCQSVSLSLSLLLLC